MVHKARRFHVEFCRGKKYARLKAEAEAKNALKKYEPFLVQSRNFE